MTFLVPPYKPEFSIEWDMFLSSLLYTGLLSIASVLLGMIFLTISLTVAFGYLFMTYRKYSVEKVRYNAECLRYLNICRNSFDVSYCTGRANLYVGEKYYHLGFTVKVFTNPDDEVLFTLDTGVQKGEWFKRYRDIEDILVKEMR